MTKYYILLFSLLVFTACMRDGNLKLLAINYQPEQSDDSWKIGTIDESNFDMLAFDEIVKAVFSEEDYLFINSLLIAQNGILLAEMYPKDLNHRNEPSQVWSVTKSFVSLITGIAIDKGYISDINDSIFKYLPEYAGIVNEGYKAITIEHCLTMRSGINYDNEGEEEEDLLAQVPNDLTEYILKRPLQSTPGTVNYYKNSDPQLLVKVVSNAAKTDFIQFADSGLFKPLGICDYFWSRNKDTTPYGGFGLWLTPRDLAKVGVLLLNYGEWNGDQIISKEWIDNAISIKSPTKYGYDYGYLIWTDTTENKYWFWGKGGQYLIVYPEKDLVVVITSEQFCDKEGTSLEDAMTLADRIVKNIR